MSKVVVRLADLEVAGLCQDGLDTFSSLTGGADIFEADEWTPLHEVTMQSINPLFITWLRSKRLIPFPQWSGKDLSNMNFSGADFRAADFTGCNLEGCNLSKAQMQRSILLGCDLSVANTESAIFDGAVYDGPDIHGWMRDANDSMRSTSFTLIAPEYQGDAISELIYWLNMYQFDLADSKEEIESLRYGQSLQGCVMAFKGSSDPTIDQETWNRLRYGRCRVE